jgi:Cu2+-exporting ATPase
MNKNNFQEHENHLKHGTPVDQNHKVSGKHKPKQHQEKHDNHNSHGNMVLDFKKRFIISIILTIPVLLLSPLIQGVLRIEDTFSFTGDIYVLFAISSFVFFYGGWPFLAGAFKEIKSKQPAMMTLIGLAITIGYIYSLSIVFGLKGEIFFWEIVTLIDVMLLGHWIEMRSVLGASRALETLAKLMPDTAHKILSDGSIQDVSLEEIRLEDEVLVRPGEKFPVDGVIIEGTTSANESMLTGESKPVLKEVGSEAMGGAVNGEGSVTVQVKKTGEDSFISGVIKLVKEAQASKSRTQDIASRAAFWLTIIAITVGMITLIIWWLLIKSEFVFALERTVTVMVITCPHALGLAVPLVVAVSTTLSAKNGLLIRDRAAFEKARNINAIVFDKTGTLTKGEFGITDIIVLSRYFSEEELKTYTASLEEKSEHPIAKAIAKSTVERFEVSNFKAITGRGAEATVNGKAVKIVSPGYLKEYNIELTSDIEKKFKELSGQGKTVVFILIDDKLEGAIALADIIRKESKEAISRLNKMGIEPMMLTGDNQQTAKWVAGQIGIKQYFAEVLPEDKSNKIKEVQNKGYIVAMTGDGINDAPALAQADVGIAIGAGTDVAIETADIILVKSNPLDAVSILGLSRATYRKMLQNLIWATGYNVIAIPLAAGILYPLGILLSPAIGAALMSVSTIIVAINSRFIRIIKE